MFPEGFHCSNCGKWHEGLPLDWAFNSPIYWNQIPESEREERGHWTSDLCSIDGRDFFVRGLIEIPIIGFQEPFRWGAWVSLSKKNFLRMVELWDDPRIVDEPPYFGWLSNNIPAYPNTLNLKTNVSSRNVKDRPYVHVQLTDHPLAIEQRRGITLERVAEIAAIMMHDSKK